MNKIFSFLTLEVELLMFQFSPQQKVILRLKQQTVILILVEKISMISLLITAWPISKRNLDLTSKAIQGLSEDSELNVKKLRGFFHQHIKLQLNVKPLLKEKITTQISQELSLKSFASIFSNNACHQLRMPLRIQDLVKHKSMKLFLLEDQQESQRFNKCFLISLMEKLSTNQSTQMKLLHMELQFKLVFLLAMLVKIVMKFLLLTLILFLKV